MWIRIVVLQPLRHFEEEIPPFKIIVLGLEHWDEIENFLNYERQLSFSFFCFMFYTIVQNDILDLQVRAKIAFLSQLSEYAADNRFKGIFKLLKWCQSLPPCLHPNHMAWHIAGIGHHRHFRRWWTFFKPVPLLAKKTLNFGPFWLFCHKFSKSYLRTFWCPFYMPK